MTKLGKGLRLDLADPLPGHAELPPHFFQRPGMSVDQSEAKLDHLLLAFGQRVQDRLQLLLQEDEAGRVDRHDGLGVLDEISEM